MIGLFMNKIEIVGFVCIGVCICCGKTQEEQSRGKGGKWCEYKGGRGMWKDEKGHEKCRNGQVNVSNWERGEKMDKNKMNLDGFLWTGGILLGAGFVIYSGFLNMSFQIILFFLKKILKIVLFFMWTYRWIFYLFGKYLWFFLYIYLLICVEKQFTVWVIFVPAYSLITTETFFWLCIVRQFLKLGLCSALII